MFTIADICNIAIQIEKNGAEAYRKAGIKCNDPEVAAFLHEMADEELQHGQWLETIISSQQPLNAEQIELELIGKNLLQDMIRGNGFLLTNEELEAAQQVDDVIKRSKDLEEDTILFYQFIANLLEDAAAIRQMQLIITEERNHLCKLKHLEEHCHTK